MLIPAAIGFLGHFNNLTLTKRFAIVSFLILLIGMLTIGWWVTRQIEDAVFQRTASIAASFVSSAVAPLLDELSQQSGISEERTNALDTLLTETELGQRIVSFKIWSPDGEILYSPDRGMVGRRFDVGTNLQAALDGKTIAAISDLEEPENEFERQRFLRLAETYTPLRILGTGEIVGAVEFYERTGPLETELSDARLRSWLIVGGATVMMYVLLVGMVGRASRTISWQRRELARADAQSELNRMKDEFVSGVSHELLTPLGFIKGYATTMLREDVDIASKTGKEFLQIIDDESGKLERMIEDLLDTSRIRSGTLALRPKATKLQSLLDGALERARPISDKSGRPIRTNYHSADVVVMADPERIEQVIYNLVDNSIRYSSPGKPITILAEALPGEVLVSISDCGEGIPEAELGQVFEPFQRGEGAATRRARGTGLGLAVSRAIVEAHGGHIWAESEPGRGTTMRFTIPTAPDADQQRRVNGLLGDESAK